jgi:hypothetical protein
MFLGDLKLSTYKHKSQYLESCVDFCELEQLQSKYVF